MTDKEWPPRLQKTQALSDYPLHHSERSLRWVLILKEEVKKSKKRVDEKNPE
jgi:hypothetical protein